MPFQISDHSNSCPLTQSLGPICFRGPPIPSTGESLGWAYLAYTLIFIAGSL